MKESSFFDFTAPFVISTWDVLLGSLNAKWECTNSSTSQCVANVLISMEMSIFPLKMTQSYIVAGVEKEEMFSAVVNVQKLFARLDKDFCCNKYSRLPLNPFNTKSWYIHWLAADYCISHGLIYWALKTVQNFYTGKPFSDSYVST